MTHRVRQHELESESRTAFEAAIGSRFVVRAITPDYGLDVDVEEFDERGVATGLRYFGQLKATDVKNLKRALTVRLPLAKETYYRSLAVPVLMVRYHAPTHALYTRWFHDFDPFYDGERSQTSVPFRWRTDDLWNERTSERLAAEARAFMRFRQPILPLPLTLFVERDDDNRHRLTDTEAVFAIQRAASRTPALVEIARGPAPYGEAIIRIKSGEIVFVAQGVGSATYHLPPQYEAGEYGDVLAADVLTTVALGLAQLRQPDVASRFTAAFSEGSTLLSHPAMIWALSSAMATSRRVLEGLSLAQRLDEHEDAQGYFAALIFTLPALFHSHGLMPTEAAELRRVLARRAELLEDRGYPELAAAARYSLGNYYRTHREPRLAVREYRDAMRLDASYANRAYIWAEIGGALFGAGRFRASAGAYSRARVLAPDDRFYVALHADAVMFTGAYDEARDGFGAALQAGGEPGGEWILKHWLLSFLVDGLGMVSQRRDSTTANENVERAVASEDDSVAAQFLDDAIASDALSSLAWFNSGFVARKLGQDQLQWTSYLAAAVLQPEDVESWVNALMLGVNQNVDPPLIWATIAAAHRFGGEDTKRQLVKFLREQSEDFDRDAIVALYDEVASVLPRDQDDPLTLRLFGDDETEIVELARRAGTTPLDL